MSIRTFGEIGDAPVLEITLHSAAGAQAKVLTWGAVLRDLIVPLADGTMQRVVLGLETLEDYLNHSPHFGAIAGRYANRIGHGRFMLDGKAYQLPLNQENRHSLHGGGQGFGKSPWTLLHHDASSATLGLISPDGDAGYPGTLNVTCRYVLSDTGSREEPKDRVSKKDSESEKDRASEHAAKQKATLRVELSAFTDAPTILNLAHHSYFNLDGSPDILDHELMVRANIMTPVDRDLIPDGSMLPVSGTPYDFRRPRAIRLMNEDGSRFWYDHNFVLRRERREPNAGGIDLAHAATLASAKSGIAMEVWTTEPCLQIYDGFKINLPVSGLRNEKSNQAGTGSREDFLKEKGATKYGANAGIAMEPQHAPDSPNLPHMPSTVLRPGELYRQVSEYRFG